MPTSRTTHFSPASCVRVSAERDRDWCWKLTCAIWFALSAASVARADVELDPREVMIDEIETENELKTVEKRFAGVTEVRSLFANCQRFFRYVTNSELRRLHQTAKFERSEFQEFESVVQFGIRKVILDICQDRLCRVDLQRSGFSSGNTFGQLAPSTHAEDVVIAVAKAHLPEHRYRQYVDEINDRRSFRRRSVAEAITASLDSRLFLSEQQRESISGMLQREWHDPWLLCMRHLVVHGVETMPLLPKEEIESKLSDSQKALFSKLQWKPFTVPSIGPSELTMKGYQQRKVSLVDDLQFASASVEARDD